MQASYEEEDVEYEEYESVASVRVTEDKEVAGKVEFLAFNDYDSELDDEAFENMEKWRKEGYDVPSYKSYQDEANKDLDWS